MHKLTEYLVDFSQAQCIATLICLPFLVHWGLPLSIMSFVGNLLFTPFLTAFLILSSLLFFTELLYIPNEAIIFSLTKLACVWQYFLKLGSKHWLIGFAGPPFLVLLVIPLITILLVHREKQTTRLRRLVMLTTLCSASLLFLSVYSTVRWHQPTYEQPSWSKKLEVKKEVSGISIIDRGAFTKKMNIKNAIAYKVKPYLYQNFGTHRIERYIIRSPRTASFQAAIELCKVCDVRAVCLPYFESELSKQDWYFYFEMKRVLKIEGVKLLRKGAL